MPKSVKYSRRYGTRLGGRSKAYMRRGAAAGKKRRAAGRTLPSAMAGYQRTVGYYGGAKELKFFDTDIALADVLAIGSVWEPSLNLIPQGTEQSQRIGRKCTLKSINVRFNVKLGSQTGPLAASETVRVMVVLDKQCNGLAATVAGLLETANYQSFNNLAEKSRFRVLCDRTYDLNAQASSGAAGADETAPVVINDTLFKSVNLPIEFNEGATGAITEIRSNNVFMLAIAEIGGLASIDGTARVRFVG